FRYTTEIMSGSFELSIIIENDTDIVTTSLVEKENGEEYVLYKTNASGAYVGEVRSAIEEVLARIAQNCYDPAVFKSVQAQKIIEYVRNQYGDEPEYLWTKFPDNAVWRRKDNQKWYGAILTVSKNKLGFDEENIAEIVDLRCLPENMGNLLPREGYFPGWHMNKKSWYTILLDGTVSEKEIYEHIDESYRLAGSVSKRKKAQKKE
ncbi:MAG: MmcQ/YjbR family DNA-binding protein, partial [Alistipes sp.]|nr:MmcQ/YjbR family DNA-binding protein [Alistipes sp.]